MNLGWMLRIVRACPDPSLSFTFFAGSLGVIIVAASRCLLEVCASMTGNILGVVSHWHLFPYLSIFADFSSFPFLEVAHFCSQFLSGAPHIQQRRHHHLSS